MDQRVMPARVLKTIRDNQDIALAELLTNLGLAPLSCDVGALAELSDCLQRFVEAGLITRTPPGESRIDTHRIFSSDGLPHIMFRTTEQLDQLQVALRLSLTELTRREARTHIDDCRRIRDVRVRLDKNLGPSCFRQDLVASVGELAICLEAGCYIAVMALSGKILEICLKQRMVNGGATVDDSWMLGTLLGKSKEVAGLYMDPSLTNIANIIKESRIPAVHAKRDIPIPSEDQAHMVVRATLDVLERTMLSPA